ncbi:6-carboxytetrahydropterin synthase QueD [Candidatus Peregrinibacteria bacterium CG_4_10_14_0_2_um_filter_41_8]|nr:MAG: 6-carboxytetrahydropterin synthase QueD [Candidatus Peregrinibacteria bacterium CG_4_10_14_0_2_um_filter_41_8]
MKSYVTKEFTFDAAHYLTNYYGKCEKLHGHTYKLHITIEGEIGTNGLILDFVILKKIVKDHVLVKLDHTNINDLLPNPSCELIAKWIWEQLEPLPTLLKEELNNPNLSQEIQKYLTETGPINTKDFSQKLRLFKIKLWETPTSYVTLRADA